MLSPAADWRVLSRTLCSDEAGILGLKHYRHEFQDEYKWGVLGVYDLWGIFINVSL